MIKRVDIRKGDVFVIFDDQWIVFEVRKRHLFRKHTEVTLATIDDDNNVTFSDWRLKDLNRLLLKNIIEHFSSYRCQ